MNEHRDQYSLALMCRALKVARAGFYQWLHKPMSDRAAEGQRLLTVIRNSYAASGGVYGARRVFGDVREAGETCGKHKDKQATCRLLTLATPLTLPLKG